jgi:predicted Zn-dependent protease
VPAGSYGARALPPSLDFWLAKVRIQVRYGTETPQALLTYFDSRLQKGDYPLKDAAIYGKALALLQLKRTDEADTLMQELATRHPEDLFVVDALTDIDLAKGRSAQAIARLERFRTRMPDNEVVVVNLGNAYLEGQLQEVHRHPDPYAREHDENSLAWSLLSDAYCKAGRMTDLHMARAETLSCAGTTRRPSTN